MKTWGLVQDTLIWRLARWCLKDDAGGVTILFAAVIAAIVGAGGVVIETGIWNVAERRAQGLADLAAMAGIREFMTSGSEDDAREASQQILTVNNAAGYDISVNVPPTAGPHQGDEDFFEVVLSAETDTLLSMQKLLGKTKIEVRAVTQIVRKGNACILALDDDDTGVKISGNTTVTFAGCGVAANSDDDDAIEIKGSANATGTLLYTVGEVDANSNRLDGFDRVVENGTPIPNPYGMSNGLSGGDLDDDDCHEGWPAQNASDDDDDDEKGKGKGKDDDDGDDGDNGDSLIVSMPPGYYCEGDGHDAFDYEDGTQLILSPGTYYIEDLEFGTKDNGTQLTITCPDCTLEEGVKFILLDDAEVDITPNMEVDLQASSSDGILFDARHDDVDDLEFDLSGTSSLNGILVAPYSEVKFAGHSSFSTCLQMVVKSIEFTGRSRIDFSGCGEMGVQEIRPLISAAIRE